MQEEGKRSQRKQIWLLSFTEAVRLPINCGGKKRGNQQWSSGVIKFLTGIVPSNIWWEKNSTVGCYCSVYQLSVHRPYFLLCEFRSLVFKYWGRYSPFIGFFQKHLTGLTLVQTLTLVPDRLSTYKAVAAAVSSLALPIHWWHMRYFTCDIKQTKRSMFIFTGSYVVYAKWYLDMSACVCENYGII